MRRLAKTDLDEIVDATEDVFRGLRGARLFLTGATGFYGVWLVAALAHARLKLGVEIPLTILTRDPDAARARHGAVLEAAAAELVRGDARTFAFPEGTFTHVVHGATSASAQLNANDPFEMFDVITSGTRRALELARRSGAQRFLLMSSGAVYGTQPTTLTNVPETFTGGPDPLDVANANAE
jgi:dTDP-glucose 4,6-dehydratase